MTKISSLEGRFLEEEERTGGEAEGGKTVINPSANARMGQLNLLAVLRKYVRGDAGAAYSQGFPVMDTPFSEGLLTGFGSWVLNRKAGRPHEDPAHILRERNYT